MSKSFIRLIGRFIGFLALQTVFATMIDFGPILFISLYPLFLLTLPPHYSTSKLMVIAFIMGILVDFLTNSIIGINSAAAVLMVALSPMILKVTLQKGELDENQRAGLKSMGRESFLLFIFLNLTLHHTAIVIIENGGFALFSESLSRLFVSLFFNTLIIFVMEYGLFYKTQK